MAGEPEEQKKSNEVAPQSSEDETLELLAKLLLTEATVQMDPTYREELLNELLKQFKKDKSS